MSTMTSRLSSMVNSWSSALDQRRAGRGWIMSGAPQKDPDASKQFRQTTPVVGARGIHSTDRKWVEPVFEGPRAKLATTCSTREGVPTHRVCSTCRFFHLKKNSLLFFYFHLSLSCWGLRYLKPTGDFLYFFDSVYRPGIFFFFILSSYPTTLPVKNIPLKSPPHPHSSLSPCRRTVSG